MISLIRNSILELKKQGVSILLVEQRVEAILPVADEVIIIENGSKIFSSSSKEFKNKATFSNGRGMEGKKSRP